MAAPTFWFDLTTTAQWTGRPTGIVRTEQELARRAPAFFGDRLHYCLWSHRKRRYYALDPAIAAQLINGGLKLDPNRAPPLPAPETWRTRFARALGRNRPALTGDLERLTRGPAAIPPDATLLTAGLDWDYKDLRDIRAARIAGGYRITAMLYDMVAVTHPGFVPPDTAARLVDYVGELFWTADRLLAISADTAAAASSWATANALNADIGIVTLGSDLPAAAPEPLPQDLEGYSYALAAGTIEPRKNHIGLVDAWGLAIAQNRIDPAKQRLVFAGAIGWSADAVLAAIDKNDDLKRSILILQGLSDAELARLYEDAAVVLVPSHHEGYGLTLAEALARRRPVIASASGALREIGGDAVPRIAPGDVAAWSDAISEALRAPPPAPAVQLPTWDESAEQIFAAAEHRA